MKTAIFLKSFARDFPWLFYARDSIRKFCSGFDEIILALPEGESFDWTEARIVHFRERSDKYLEQQAIKLYADQLTDADYIVFHDSDSVFTRPICPKDFFIDGKVYWIHKAFREDEQRAWGPVVSKWMGEPSTRSFMTRHDFCLPRWLLRDLRAYCLDFHKQELCDYIQDQHVDGRMLQFSEYNCAGAYVWKYKRNEVFWLNGDTETVPPVFIHQGFTHGGEERKQQDIAEFKRILAEPQPGFNRSVPVSIPLEIVHDVKFHVEALAKYCERDGFAKGRVVRQLQLAGIVPTKKKRK